MENKEVIESYDSFEDAINITINCANKKKKQVAHFLWGSLNPERAHQRLIECTNPDKNQKLHVDEIITIMLYCGRYDAFYYICDELGFERPKKKTYQQEDEEAREILNHMQKTLDKSYELLKRIVMRREKVEEIREKETQLIAKNISLI